MQQFCAWINTITITTAALLQGFCIWSGYTSTSHRNHKGFPCWPDNSAFVSSGHPDPFSHLYCAIGGWPLWCQQEYSLVFVFWLALIRGKKSSVRDERGTGKSPTRPAFVPRCASPGIPLPACLLGSVSGWAASFCPFRSRSKKGFYCYASQHTYWLPQTHPVSLSFPFGKFASESYQINPFSRW